MNKTHLPRLLLAGVLALSLCACAAPADDPAPAPAAPVQTQPAPAAPSQTPDEVPTAEPAAPEDAPQLPPSEDLTQCDAPTVVVETLMIDGAFDEVCSYGFALPALSGGDEAAMQTINAFFDDLAEGLSTWCGTTVYDEALSRNTVATVDGTFTATQAGALLRTVYTVRVCYADQDGAALEKERTVAFDVRTGEVVEDSAS